MNRRQAKLIKEVMELLEQLPDSDSKQELIKKVEEIVKEECKMFFSTYTKKED